jgi:biotin carboxyl carrier protein
VSKQRLFEEIALENGIFETRVTKKFSLRKPYVRQNPGVVKAVIPGVVSDIVANVGTAVNQGDTILILEAMKMLNRIVAPLHGTIKAVHVSRGEKVAKGKVLMEIDSNGLLIKENRQGSRKS